MRKTQLKRQVSTAAGDLVARLLRPSKESSWRWTATVVEGPRTTFAVGDTIEEACDALQDQLAMRTRRSR